MLIITVHGVYNNTPKDKLIELIANLQSIVKDVREIEIKPEQVKVFFPIDMLQQTGKVIFTSILISDIYEVSGRTYIPVLKEIIMKIGKILETYFEGYSINVNIDTDDYRYCWTN